MSAQQNLAFARLPQADRAPQNAEDSRPSFAQRLAEEEIAKLKKENKELADAGKGFFTTEILVRSKEALEENLRLKKENAELKKYKEQSEKNWGDLSEKFEGDRDCWRWAEVEMWIEKLKKELDEAKKEHELDMEEFQKTSQWDAECVQENEVAPLKKELEEVKHREYCLRQDAKGHSPSEVQEYRDEIEELKKESNKILIENVRDLLYERDKFDCEVGWKDIAWCVDYFDTLKETEKRYKETHSSSDEEVEDNNPEEYGEYTWKQGLTAEEIAKVDKIDPETGEEKIDMEKEEKLLKAQIEGEGEEIECGDCGVCGCYHSEYDPCGTNCSEPENK